VERSERAYFLGALGVASSRVLSIVAGVASLWLLTRILSAEAFAAYSVAMSVVLLAGYSAGIGLERAMLVRIGSGMPENGQLTGTRMMLRIALITAVLSLVAAAVLVLFATAGDARHSVFLGYLAPVIPATALSLVVVTWYQANHRVGVSQAMQGLNDGIRTLVFALSLLLGWGATGVAAGAFLGAAAPLAFLGVRAIGRASADPSELGARDVLAGTQFLAIRLSQMGLDHVGIIAMGALGTATGTAQYVVAARFSQLVDSGRTFFAPTFAPRVRRHMALGQLDLAAREYGVARIVGFNGALVLAIFFVAAGQPLLDMFGGFGSGYPAFLILVAAHLLSVGAGLHVTFLSMSENLGASTLNRVTSLILFAAVLIGLVPRFDAVGAALAYLVATTFHEVIGVALLRRFTGIRALDLKEAATVGLAAIAVCAVAAGMATPAAGALVLSAFLGISLIRERALMAAITGELIGLLRGRE